MSLVTAAVQCLLPFVLAQADVCELSEGFSPAQVSMASECSARVASPDRKFVLEVSQAGRAQIKNARGASVSSAARIEGPLMVGWSPSSKAVPLNDGKGSGQTSELLVGRLRNGRFNFDQNRCAPEQLSPNVWGVAWTVDGKRLRVVAQPVLHEPCGQPYSFACYEVDVATSVVVNELPPLVCRSEWGEQLPEVFRIDD